MRDLIVTALFAIGAIYALRRPYYGALLWVWVGLMNPHRLGWGFAYNLPFAMTTVLLIAVAGLFARKSFRWLGGAPSYLLILLIGWMTITSAMAILPEPSWEKYVDVLKVLGMALVVGSLVRTREEIMGLLWIMIGSIAYFGVKGGFFTIITGGAHRVWGPASSAISGNNELALAVVVIIPFMYYLSRHLAVAREFALAGRIPAWMLKYGLHLSVLLCFVSALGSHSRGALLAITAMSAMLWWRSRAKFTLGLALLLVATIGLAVMPDAWFSRMETIQTFEQDLSALNRLNSWQTAYNIANDRLFGAGFVTAEPLIFNLYSPHPEWVFVAHSIYFDMLGSHGYVGLVLYLVFWFATYWVAMRLVKRTAGRADLVWANELGNMAKVSLVGFAVGGAFLSLAYWDMPFYVMVILVATERLVREMPAASGAT